MKSLPVILLAAMTLIQGAHAACRQADAKGTWITYQAAYITAPGGEHVGQCQLTVDATGGVNPSNSFCQFVTFNTPNIPTGGVISVNSDCSAIINLDLGNFAGQVQLTKTKDSFTGRFVAQGGTVSGVTNGAKK
jgi:ethanolamine utilization microcompartment shell protein EutS